MCIESLPATCDDGDPCTDDACIAGACDNAPKTGLDAITCTCDQPLPAACTDAAIPRNVSRFTGRACRLFARAVEAPPRARRRRLRLGAKALARAISAASRAQIRGLAPECAAALVEQYRTAHDRATLEASSI